MSNKTCRYWHILLLVGCTVLFAEACSIVWADGIAQSLPMEKVFEQKEPIVIPVTSAPSKAELDFAAPMVKKDGVLCIKFRAFLNMDEPGGWSQYLRLTLNGKSLGASTPDNLERLLNRGSVCTTTIGNESWWKRDTLLTFFGPETELDPRVTSSRDEGYWYLLNISDAANFTWLGLDDRKEGGIPNHLVIENLFSTGLPCREMIIKDLTVGYISQAELNKLRGNGEAALPTLAGKKIAGKGSFLTVAASGAMELNVGRDRYLISSAYSYPGESIGYNRFSWENGSAPEWKVSLQSGKDLIVTGDYKTYRVVRKIVSKEGKFFIYDTIENKTDAPLGMSIRHRVFTPKAFAPGDAYLCGVVDSRRMDACAANPTTFIRQRRSSLGTVCEDTLFRMQLVEDRTYSNVQFGTEHFGLEPHAKYTLEWTLYPSQGRDYFAFINRVRNDWGVNYTIPGPASFTKAFVPKRDMKVYIMTPWYAYYNGVELNDEKFKEIQQAQIAKLLADDPNAITMGLIENNLIPIDRSAINGSENLPAEPTYGVRLTAEQGAPLAKSPWFDSMIKDENGVPYVDTVYEKPPFMNLLVYPTLDNYQYKYLIKQIDFLMDEVGFKGIYIDQFELANTVQGMGRADYSKWDGHTVDLDSKGQIASKYTDATYVGTAARAAVIKHVLDKGGIMITNGHSYAKETSALKILNFSETEWDVSSGQEVLSWNEPPALPSIAEAHLDSPIGLGIRPARFPEFGMDHVAELIHKWVITCLKNGILYYYYHDTIPETGPGAGEYGELNHMFPFTPVELHAGWVVGEERIITAKSGNFFWNHNEKPVVLLFDINGRAKTPNAKITKHGNGWLVKLKMTDWQETAVIEPIEATK